MTTFEFKKIWNDANGNNQTAVGVCSWIIHPQAACKNKSQVNLAVLLETKRSLQKAGYIQELGQIWSFKKAVNLLL